MHDHKAMYPIKNATINVALKDAAAVISRAVVRTSDVATLKIFPVPQMKHGAYYVSTAYFSDESNY